VSRERLLLGIAAVTGFTLNFAMFIAFDLVTIALALLVFYTYPAMVVVVAVALGRERLDRSKLAALGLALAGMVAVVAGQLDPAAGIEFNWLGVLLALSAAVSQAVFVLISRDGYPSVPADQAMTVMLATTVAFAVPVAVLTGSFATLTFPLSEPSVLPLVLFAGVFGAAIPSIGFLTGLRLIGGLRAGILMLFEPVVGVLLAALLLDEDLQPIQLVGGVAILAAAVILQRSVSNLTRTDRTWLRPSRRMSALAHQQGSAPKSAVANLVQWVDSQTFAASGGQDAGWLPSASAPQPSQSTQSDK